MIRRRLFWIVLAVVMVPTLLAAACALQPATPDPAQVEARVAEFREEERALILETVADSGRAERLLTLLDERDRLIGDSTRAIRDHRGRMARLNADYHAPREQFDALLAAYNEQRSRMQLRFVDVIGRMKAETTAAEWKVIARFQLKNLNPRRLVYGQVEDS